MNVMNGDVILTVFKLPSNSFIVPVLSSEGSNLHPCMILE